MNPLIKNSDPFHSDSSQSRTIKHKPITIPELKLPERSPLLLHIPRVRLTNAQINRIHTETEGQKEKRAKGSTLREKAMHGLARIHATLLERGIDLLVGEVHDLLKTLHHLPHPGRDPSCRHCAVTPAPHCAPATDAVHPLPTSLSLLIASSTRAGLHTPSLHREDEAETRRRRNPSLRPPSWLTRRLSMDHGYLYI